MLSENKKLAASQLSARAALALAMALVAVALDAPQAQQTDAARPPTIRESVYVALRAAQACAEDEDFECADERLDELFRMPLSGYEIAQVWSFRAFIQFSRGDTAGATAAYENILRIDFPLPRAMEAQTAYSLAQLYMHGEDYGRALEKVDEYLALAETPLPEIYFIRALAQHEQGRLDAALESVGSAIARSRDPRESHYGLRYQLQEQLGDVEGMIETLEILASRWPSDAYSAQLAQLQGAP